MDSLVNTTSNGKNFSFKAHNIDGMMKCFNDKLIANIYVYDRGSDIDFDTGIYNNKCI